MMPVMRTIKPINVTNVFLILLRIELKYTLTVLPCQPRLLYNRCMTNRPHTSLRDKLGIKPGMRLYFERAPSDVMVELGDLDDQTTVVHDAPLANFQHYFVSTRTQLFNVAEKLQHLRAPGQIIWISWPKKSAKIKTNISEQDLRDALLPIGLVETKVCAVSDIYTGLKFVWRNR